MSITPLLLHQDLQQKKRIWTSQFKPNIIHQKFRKLTQSKELKILLRTCPLTWGTQVHQLIPYFLPSCRIPFPWIIVSWIHEHQYKHHLVNFVNVYKHFKIVNTQLRMLKVHGCTYNTKNSLNFNVKTHNP